MMVRGCPDILRNIQMIGANATPRMHALTLPVVSTAQPLAQLLQQRRSLRDYASTPLGIEALAALLWAAQGITARDDLRTAPSAGALYPLELYCVAGAVTGLVPGVYHYLPRLHTLQTVLPEDRRVLLADAALDQEWLAAAPVVLALGALFRRTTRKYGERGIRYVHIEVGHVAQNVCLMAGALGLGAATVGAFDDAAVQTVLGLPDDVVPLYLLPAGWAER